ncbi:MAG: histidine--tRNA ligase [Kofleriaceae bacterium]|nr:histidine--tRNA ligase [Kofleriaceae bacterium]
MAEPIQSVKGMNDVLPPDSARWQHLEATCRDLFARYGYGEIRTPVLEHTQLFARGVGEATDIVDKEMYTFEDRGQRSLTLRPEMTASCVRAYIEHAVHARDPVTRWWYCGPMFRYERAQAGRYRSFWQIGCEVFGVAEPTIDAEQIAMLVELYKSLGVGDLTVLVNTVGSAADRPAYRAALVAYFEPHQAALCGDCRRRLASNPLRILDCKVPTCKALAAHAPRLRDHLGDASRAHFDGVLAALTAMDVTPNVDDQLVRGLDYYTGTVFEITSAAGALGAQSTIVGGGRYDGLVESLGGAATPAVGFALGVERALLCMGGDPADFGRGIDLFIATRGEAARRHGTALAHRLRRLGAAVEVEHREVGMKGQFKRADRLGARFALALGDAELASGQGALKDMQARSEVTADLGDAAAIYSTIAKRTSP